MRCTTCSNDQITVVGSKRPSRSRQYRNVHLIYLIRVHRSDEMLPEIKRMIPIKYSLLLTDSLIEMSALVPHTRIRVVTPSSVRRRKLHYVKLMPLILIRPANAIADLTRLQISLDCELYRVI